MSDYTNPYSVEDIYSILSNTSIDIKNVVVHIDGFSESNYNLELLFKNNYSIIIYIPIPEQEVGHFVLLSHLEGNHLEYFDSFGKPPLEEVVLFAKRNSMKLTWNKVVLQEIQNDVCAKWCVSRMFSLPISLKDFVEIYTEHKTLKPDEIVSQLFILKRQ